MFAKIFAAASLLPPHAETVQFDALGRARAPFTLEPSPMTKPLYVVAVASNPPWVLVPEPVTAEEAARRVRWQVQGGAKPEAYRVCSFDAARDAFISDDGAEYRPGRGPYTVEAWDRYMVEIRERAQ